MNSLSFSSPNFVNFEPIEQNLKDMVANKYGKIWCWPWNYNKLEIVWSQLSTNLFIFIYINSNLKNFGLSVFEFDLFDKWQTDIQSVFNIW